MHTLYSSSSHNPFLPQDRAPSSSYKPSHLQHNHPLYYPPDNPRAQALPPTAQPPASRQALPPRSRSRSRSHLARQRSVMPYADVAQGHQANIASSPVKNPNHMRLPPHPSLSHVTLSPANTASTAALFHSKPLQARISSHQGEVKLEDEEALPKGAARMTPNRYESTQAIIVKCINMTASNTEQNFYLVFILLLLETLPSEPAPRE